MAIRAGSLRHKVTVQQKESAGVSPSGGNVVTWATLYEDVCCSISPLNGKELELARQHVSRATHKVIMRFHPGINSTMRLLFLDRVFNIGFVQNLDERNFILQLTCTEENPQ